MKKLVLISFALLFAGLLSAQVNNEGIKKDVKSTNGSTPSADDDQFNAISKILESRSFVLEATTFEEDLKNLDVSSVINFIKVDSTQATIQKGNDAPKNYRGLKGTTIVGSISNWNLKKDEKHKSFTLNMSVTTYGGRYEVQLDVRSLGYASALISGTLLDGITLRGKIVSLEESNIHVEPHL
jgi:hypothetical protein